MARITSDTSSNADVALINLTRLLARLQDNILRPDETTQRRLTSSSFERSKVGSNLDYARTLLLRLEQDSAGIKIQSRKLDLQTDLLHKRDLIERLGERLQELEELDDGTNATSDEEDLIGENTPPEELEEEAPQEESEKPESYPSSDKPEEAEKQNTSQTSQREKLFATESNSTLRSRNAQSGSQAADTGRTTSASTSTPLTTTETLLSHNRTEQESLTESLLSMAQKLKESSHSFSESLETEKDILGRAVEGLDKNQIGMEAAQKRMGYLRRMTEGKGWWGRMMMYAWIAALMIIAILIVGVMPKLRF